MAARTDPLVHMGAITGGEAREIRAAKPVILLPLGSHEDQGPHAPMGDYLLAEKIAELAAIRASERGARTLVAPVLPFGGTGSDAQQLGKLRLVQRPISAQQQREGFSGRCLVDQRLDQPGCRKLEEF